MFGFLKVTPEPIINQQSSLVEAAAKASFTEEDAVGILGLLLDGKFDGAVTAAKALNAHKCADLIQRMKSTIQIDLERSVDLSININEASFSAAEMNRTTNEINQRSQGMAAAVEEMSATAASILSSARTVSNHTEEMRQNVNLGIRASGELMRANQQIEDAVTETEKRVTDLVSSTAAIDKILAIISDISEKTKLLALNATIEAARAGEAGKGFAVVAGEVKNLANQTAESADEISQKVKALVSVTNSISEMMQGVASAVAQGKEKLSANNDSMAHIERNSNEISDQMSEISKILQDQESASRDISEGVTTAARMTHESVIHINKALDAMDAAEKKLVEKLNSFVGQELNDLTVNLAKSDHVIWKKRLASMAAGRVKLNPDELANHQGCRLGKWYYSNAADAYKSKPSFRELEGPHMEVHKHGIEAVRKYNAHDLAGALHEIELAEKASISVLSGLDKLRSKS